MSGLSELDPSVPIAKDRHMPIAHVNGIDVCYETYGSPDDPALVMINGLGSQMVRWPQGFLDLFLAAGLRVIVFDNRDVGHTTKFADAEQYTIDDMADDVAALLDHIGISAAHIAGQSMGGMIAQVLAIRHPDRVLSLASIMSATGDDPVLSVDPDVVQIFTEPPASTREQVIEQDVRHRRVMSGPGFPFDQDAMRDLATRTYDRCYAPDGRARQMLAVRSAAPRAKALSTLDVPAVVVHGTADRLVPVENGKKTAEAIPGAELVLIDGMGHDLPRGAWATIAEAIVRTSKRAAAHT